MKTKNIFAFIFLILASTLLFPANMYSQKITFSQAAPGVWKGAIGSPEEFDLLKAASVKPNMKALEELPKTEASIDQSEILGDIRDRSTYLRFPLEREEQIFGFGLNFKTIHQRGRVLTLHVDHYDGSDNGRTHAPVPFYVSDKGYGVLINSARYIKVWAGTAVRKDSEHPPVVYDRNTDKNWTASPYSDAVEIQVPAPGVEFYLFAGPTMLDVVKRYNLYMGGGCLPPRWGLGFTQRVERLYTADDVRNEVREFNEHDFPLDFIGLEPGWQSASYPCTFEWDPKRFPEPQKFVQELKDQDLRINLWTNPYVSPESPIYENIEPFTGSHTVWNGVVPDLYTPEAKRVLRGQLAKSQIDIGVSGYKIDEVDGYDRWLWPDVATFPSGVSGEQMRQTYGLKIQRTIDDLYRQRNRRTYGLVRASNAGASSLPFVIYNDYYSHRDFITALCNSGFTGILWTPEARTSDTGEEWLRRMQSVCFSPMAMINAWASDTKPWSFPEVAEEVKEIAQLRMRLMPYFYTEFAKYHFKGIPPFRAMYLEEGFIAAKKEVAVSNNLGKNPYAVSLTKEVKDQYMAGESLLVAPMFAGQKSRQVVLPPGKWYDFYTGEFVGQGEVITVEPGLEHIPVFVKDGALVPMMKPTLRAPKAGEKYDLQVRHYGTKEGRYLLYDDDGETYDYEDGEYSWRKLKVEKTKNGEYRMSISPAEKGKPNNVGHVSWKQISENN